MLSAMTNDQDAAEALRRYIIDRRMALGLSQRDVAKLGGFSAGTLGVFESGARPSIPRQETLSAFAKGLGVPYATLDRIARGLPPEPPPDDTVIVNLMADLSPDTKRLVMEWLTMNAEQRAALEAGLSALVAALRRQSQGL